MQFGSMNNDMMARSTKGAPVPEVGMGATELCWSDRHAYTVIEVSPSGKRCKVQRDNVTEWKNHYGEKFEADPNGSTYDLSLRKNGQWKVVGSNNIVFAIGYRSEYHDPHF